MLRKSLSGQWMLFGIVGAMVFGACKKDDSSDDDDSPDEELVLDLSTTIAEHLTVASPLATVSSDVLADDSLEVDSSLRITSASEDDYYSKVEALKATTTTETLSECMETIPAEFNLAQGNFGHAPCFGPAVAYSDHVDDNSSGSIGNGDLGMFWEYSDPDASSGEACSASIFTSIADNLAGYVDAAIGIQATVKCAARIAEKELPTDSDSVDYTSALDDLDLASKNLVITSAKEYVDTDIKSGDSVFVMTIEGTLTDEPRDLTKNFTLTIRHFTESTTAYRGVAQFIIEEFEDTNDLVNSIRYQWADKTMKYRYRQKQVEDGSDDDFNSSTYEVDGGEDEAGWTEVVQNVSHLGFGKLVFAWNTIDTLVFNAETKVDGTGTAYFGHSDMSNEVGTDDFYSIDGLRCFPINPAPSGKDEFSSYVQRQTYNLDSGSGEWSLDESNVLFAPTSDCDWDGSTGSFTVSKEDESGGTEDMTLDAAITNDLYSQSEYEDDWSVPSIPAGFSDD